MKILFVLNNYYLHGNGLAASARRTVHELRKAGEEVRILSGTNPNPDGPQPDFPLKPFKFPVFQPIIEASGFSYATAETRVIEEAVRWADVVHLEEMFVVQYKAIKIAKKLGKPLTATFHLHPENIMSSLGMGKWKWINELLLKLWRKYIYNHCSLVQCPTENVLDRLRRYHFKPELRLISNGVIPDPCTRPATPPENYLDPKRLLDVLYIGRLAVEKDQPTLLQAMRYSAFAKRIRLHFAGNGPKAKAYKRQAEKLYREGVLAHEPVFSFNTRDQLRALAAQTDLCVHCAIIEVEGLSIMEAMQQGAVPVIAEGRCSGASQFALDRRSIFPERNSEALAHRIDYWLSHPAERWEMGARYAKSMEKYDIALSARELIRLFRDAQKKGC